MQPYLKSTLLACSLAAGQFLKAHAEFAPILIKTNSYNCDIVVEKRSPPPAVIVTTASMDQGTANAGFTWFERGYLPEWPSTGIPEAGTLLPSDRSPDHVYRMPPTYHGPNAFLVDSTCSNAVITFKTPTNCAVLSFLTSSGVARTILGYEIRHTDGTFESGTFTSPNWYSDGDPAWSSNGRANVQTFTRSDLNTYNPRLYSVDVSVSDNFTEIAGIGLSWVSGKGHAAILSISCAPKKGDAFIPVAVSGYTHDIVVEADAVKPGAIETNTTATMEGGTNHFGFTWYERGYNPSAADSGLPAPGSMVVSENDPAHRFQLPPSYEQPDAVLLDRSGTEANIFFETPAKYSAVSFLTAASAGAPAIRCVIRHADGFTETNSFVSSDWLGTSAAAVTVKGRVDVSTKLVNSPPAGPKLYAADVPVIRQDTAITRITLARADASTANAVVVFAVAGAPVGTSPPPVRAQLAATRTPDGKISIQSSHAGRLQSSASPAGPPAAWTDEGAITQTVTITPNPNRTPRFYRVVSQ